MRSTDLLGIITNNFSSVLSDITSSNTGVQKVLTSLIASYNDLASVLSEDTIKSTDTEALLNKVESNMLSISSGGITYFPMVSTATVTDCTIDADSIAPLAAAYVAQLNSTGTWDYALPVLSTATEISTESGHIYIIPRYGYGSTTLQTLDEYIAGQTDLTKSSSYVDFMKYAFSGASAATFYYVKEANDISTLVELPTDTALGIVGKPTQTLASLITAWTAVTSSAYSWKTADSANIECLDYTFRDKLSYIDGFLKISSDCYATAYSGHNLNLSAPADNMSVDDGDTTTNYDGYVILSYILKKLGLLSLFGNGLYIEFEYYNSDGSSSMNVNQTAISENSIGSYSVTYYTETKKTHKIALGDLVTTYLGMSADDLGNLQINMLSDETLTLDADFAEAAAAYIAGTSTTNPLTEEVKLIIALTRWKWSKTILAFGSVSATHFAYACDMSMQTYLILPLYLPRRHANCLRASVPLPRVTLRTRPVSASLTTVTYLRPGRSCGNRYISSMVIAVTPLSELLRHFCERHSFSASFTHRQSTSKFLATSEMDMDSRNLIMSFANDFVIRDIGCERNGSDS